MGGAEARWRGEQEEFAYRVATRMGQPTHASIAAARRLLIYLMRTKSLGLQYGGSGPASLRLSTVRRPFNEEQDRTSSGLHAISNANWETSCSCTGFVIMLNGCAIAWAAKKQPATALSSTEAETYAAAAAAAETVWARGLMSELGYGQPEPTTLWVDNTGAAAIANDAGSVGRSWHIARRANFLLDMHLSQPKDSAAAAQLTWPTDSAASATSG